MGTNKDPNKQVEMPQAANPFNVLLDDIILCLY